MFCFEIIDVRLKEHFLDFQTKFGKHMQNLGIIYVPVLECSLENVLSAIEYVPFERGFPIDQLSLTIVDYWFSQANDVERWCQQLRIANQGAYWDSVIVCRMVHMPTFRYRLEDLAAR
jgi:hypothetical protein